ncbi:hypothetical protein ACWD11_08685 [Streptomyces sp. NPDC002776]
MTPGNFRSEIGDWICRGRVRLSLRCVDSFLHALDCLIDSTIKPISQISLSRHSAHALILIQVWSGYQNRRMTIGGLNYS